MIKKLISKKIILFSAASIFILALIFVIYTFSIIYHGVKTACLMAQNEYQEDCVDSLIKYVQSDEHSFKERNTAIWALGQLADKRALPLLQSLYTGEDSVKEPLNKAISQYELKKAITWCEKGNVTSWMYRNRDTWPMQN
ncbi:MAG: HEAT repeat domain-containing protein [Candidatus Levyibacteriota bacterium]